MSSHRKPSVETKLDTVVLYTIPEKQESTSTQPCQNDKRNNGIIQPVLTNGQQSPHNDAECMDCENERLVTEMLEAHTSPQPHDNTMQTIVDADVIELLQQYSTYLSELAEPQEEELRTEMQLARIKIANAQPEYIGHMLSIFSHKDFITQLPDDVLTNIISKIDNAKCHLLHEQQMRSISKREIDAINTQTMNTQATRVRTNIPNNVKQDFIVTLRSLHDVMSKAQNIDARIQVINNITQELQQ